MKKLLLIAFAMMLIIIPSVRAGQATGSIRIDPALPIMLTSPANFEIWVQPGGNPTHDVNILLVMTQASFDGWTAPEDFVVSWSGAGSPLTIAKAAFTDVTENSERVPDSGTTAGGSYTVASLKDHLSTGLSDPLSSTDTIYWAKGLILPPGTDLTTTHVSITVTLPSTDPRMLVYLIGKTGESTLFNNKVPPTIPGFVVPELGPMLLALASFSALAVYAIRRRKAA